MDKNNIKIGQFKKLFKTNCTCYNYEYSDFAKCVGCGKVYSEDKNEETYNWDHVTLEREMPRYICKDCATKNSDNIVDLGIAKPIYESTDPKSCIMSFSILNRNDCRSHFIYIKLKFNDDKKFVLQVETDILIKYLNGNISYDDMKTDFFISEFKNDPQYEMCGYVGYVSYKYVFDDDNKEKLFIDTLKSLNTEVEKTIEAIKDHNNSFSMRYEQYLETANADKVQKDTIYKIKNKLFDFVINDNSYNSFSVYSIGVTKKYIHIMYEFADFDSEEFETNSYYYLAIFDRDGNLITQDVNQFYDHIDEDFITLSRNDDIKKFLLCE